MRTQWWWRAPRELLALGVGVVLLAVIIVGATSSNYGSPPPVATPTPRSSTTVPTDPARAAPTLLTLESRIADMEKDHGILVGVAISSVAPGSMPTQKTWHSGTLYAGPALQTMDVPMAVAVVREGKSTNDAYLFHRSLAGNSSSADDAMWAFLGTPHEASAKVNEALRSLGDYNTVVNPDDEPSPYAAATWSVANQASTMGALWCSYVELHPAVSQLNDASDDPWGMAWLPNSYTKGDIAELEGDAFIRQMGIITLHDGTKAGVAMAISSPDHDSEELRKLATELAYTIREEAGGIAAPSCPR